MTLRNIVALASLGGAVASGALSACSAPDAAARGAPFSATRGPDFRPVALMVVDRCGSIDCHGSKYRNMRLYGFGTSRLDPLNQPDAPDMTQAEADQDYDAITAVEPDILREVVAAGGKGAERLTFVRKARGQEAHKGGQRIAPGDAADVCLLSWLASAVDTATCKSAVPRLF